MATAIIKKTKNPTKNISTVYLTESFKSKDFDGFSKEELQYLDDLFNKKSKKSAVINRLKTIEIIQLVEAKKTHYLTLEACRLAGVQILAQLNGFGAEKANVVDLTGKPELAAALCEGISLAGYQFLKYKKIPTVTPHSLSEIHVVSKAFSDIQIKEQNIVNESVFIARDLVNEPLNYLNAEQLGKEAKSLGKDAGIKVEILNKSKIESLKMGGLLAVNFGSIDPPVFIVMEYKPNKSVNKQPIVFVGKGVVYDTGGMSLKPTPGSMDSMKCDMAGSAAAIAAIYAIAKAELPVHVVTLVPATDNRVDGNAMVPGDVITISDGTTVEVLNTDAEGRLILSDALVYAKRYKPAVVIDLATLTGAASRAIGPFGIVAMGTAVEDFNELKRCGDQVHERIVEFPLWDDYAEMIKSDIADIKNIGGATAGANTAGKFLERFTDYPWIHLDIAGPAFSESKDAYRGKGGTGVGVRLLFDFVKNKAEA